MSNYKKKVIRPSLKNMYPNACTVNTHIHKSTNLANFKEIWYLLPRNIIESNLLWSSIVPCWNQREMNWYQKITFASLLSALDVDAPTNPLSFSAFPGWNWRSVLQIFWMRNALYNAKKKKKQEKSLLEPVACGREYAHRITQSYQFNNKRSSEPAVYAHHNFIQTQNVPT